jgi:Domain of Unknown Function with PDB structure (DUF3857)/Transglutaminase-like superfamily
MNQYFKAYIKGYKQRIIILLISGGLNMKKFRISRTGIIICTLLLIAGLFSSAIAENAPKEVLDKISSIGDKDDYPNANFIIIEDIKEYEYNHAGQVIATSYNITKVLTEKGKNEIGDYHIGYFLPYDTITIEFARVIKQNGDMIDVPDDYIKDKVSGVAEAMNIYEPDAREKIISFKDLQVGDCIEYKIIDHLYHAPMDSIFDGLDIFQYPEPLIYKRTTITGPEDMPLSYVVRRGEISFEKARKDGMLTYSWWAENQPPIVTEPAMPSLIEIAPTVIFSTVKSWEEISRWWYSIAESKMELNDSLRMVIDSLTDGKSKDEAIESVYHYVAQTVRYMGLGTGKKKGFEPKPVVETFETKYGVCRDVAALMTAMLREADIDADITLTASGYKIDPEIPHIIFNHAIVAIKDDQGEYYYSDPTVENLPVLFPSMEQEQNVLICNREGRTLEETPHQSAEENLGHISANSQLTAEGSFMSDVVMTADATYDMILRSIVKSMPDKQARMLWSQIIQMVYTGANLTYFEISDADDLDTPLTIKFGYKIDNYALNVGDYLLVKMPISTGNFEILSLFMLESAKLPEREHPWRIGFTYGAEEEEILSLPDGYELKAYPEDHSLEFDHSMFRTAYTSYAIPEPQEGKLKVSYQKKFLLDKTQMTPEEYQEFLKVLQAKDKATRGEIILVREES